LNITKFFCKYFDKICDYFVLIINNLSTKIYNFENIQINRINIQQITNTYNQKLFNIMFNFINKQ